MANVSEQPKEMIEDVSGKTRAASTLKITGQTVPSSNFYYKKKFYCKGTITSNYNLIQISGRIECNGKTIYDCNGFSFKAQKNYVLNNGIFDGSLKFDKLQAGKVYNYVVEARDASMSKMKKLISASFMVITDLRITGHTRIRTIKEGKAWVCKGIVRSSYNLKEVTGAILDPSSKTPKYIKTVKPNKKTYALPYSEIDDALLFNKLKASAKPYIYEVTAKDASGYSKTLVHEEFYVKK